MDPKYLEFDPAKPGSDQTVRVLFVPGHPPMIVCSDYDDDCPDVVSKTRCWLRDPTRGVCPYLGVKLD